MKVFGTPARPPTAKPEEEEEEDSCFKQGRIRRSEGPVMQLQGIKDGNCAMLSG